MKKSSLGKGLALCLMAAMSITQIPVSAETVSENTLEAEQQVYDSFQTADGLTYIILTSETEQYIRITGCDKNATSVTIPSEINGIPVTEIKAQTAFYGCNEIETFVVEEGNTVFESRGNAIIRKKEAGKSDVKLIAGCKNTVIPNDVTSIEPYAFYGCSGLKEIILPDSLKYIYNDSFSESGLTSIKIPDSVEYIGPCTFKQCKDLSHVELPDGLTRLLDETFTGCSSLEEIVLPDSITELGYDAFCLSGLKKIVIPSGVTNIPSGLLRRCENLESVTIPDGVTSIGILAFDRCSSLTDIKIPASVTSIRYSAFFKCSSLTSIKIPEGVTQIEEDTFSQCKSLEYVGLPASLTSIDTIAFTFCSKLKDVYYGGSKEQYEAAALYDFGDTVTIHYNATMPDGIHTHVKDAGTTVAATCEEKGSTTYKCKICGEVMEKTETNALGHTWDAGKITKEPTVEAEGVRTYTCTTCGKTKTESVAKKTETTAAAGTKLKEKTGREFKVIKSNASESKPSVMLTKLSAKDKKAKKVTIPKTVTVDNVKYQVTGIAAKAFKNSKKLQTVVIPDTVTEIGTGSFEGCKNLKSVTIGKNVTSIGKNAFKNCKNLKKITVKSTKLKKVGKGALTGINKKCVIKVPKKQLKSYKSLFKGKGQKKSVKITK